ncbi:ABC transporter G family member 1-like [Arachis stenosperma]|uniref:ABC transporter G family member 1-like n=1 Tax=Arachis stenosperma TaxID=217475 RepID=UPI0025AD1EAC|nr:ABC transporter G family member 1-like [Arachis stenosperma]
MFFDIGSSSESIQARASLLVFVVTFLTFITVGAFPYFVEDMKVFERKRPNGHYGVTAYTIGNTLSSVPFLLLMSLIPGAVVYYLVGLHQGHQEFIYFTSILFVSVFLVEGLMMIVASIVSNFLLGIIFGTGILGYAYQGLFKNEFQDLTFTGNNQDGGAMKNISGEEILRNLWQVEIGYSKWNDVVILIGMAVTYSILFLVIIKSFEKVKPIVVTAMNNCPQAKFRFTKVTRLGAMA